MTNLYQEFAPWESLGKVTGKCSSGHCPWNDIYICRFAHIVQDFVLGVKNIYIYKYIHINFFGRLFAENVH